VKRKTLSKSLRFDVFRRDSFRCRYCGKQPPDVILVCDHIIPVAKHGPTTLENLCTSCEDCNSGKAAKPLTSPVPDSLEHLAALQERLEELQAIQKQARVAKRLQSTEKAIRLDLENHWLTAFNLPPLPDEVSPQMITILYRSLKFLDINTLKGLITLCAKRKIGADPQDQYRYMCGILKNKKREGQ
jgi:hypothetical protein